MAVPRRRPTEVAVLALFYSVSGVLSLLASADPLTADSSTDLTAIMGAVGLAGAALIWQLGRRWPVAVMHTALAAVSGLVAVLAWQTVTVAGIAGLGPVLICIGLFASHFCTVRVARCHVLGAVTAVTAGVMASGIAHSPVPWLVDVVACVLVTEVQLRLVRKLRDAATVDSLTGLLNRGAWMSVAGHALAHAKRQGLPLTIALLDLDDFKCVNDEQGHHAGDVLLRELADAWQRALRRSDVLGRYGGDEFAVLLPGADTDAAQEVLERMVLAHPAIWSAGLAQHSGDHQTVEGLLRRADASLYENKRLRKSTVAARSSA